MLRMHHKSHIFYLSEIVSGPNSASVTGVCAPVRALFTAPKPALRMCEYPAFYMKP